MYSFETGWPACPIEFTASGLPISACNGSGDPRLVTEQIEAMKGARVVVKKSPTEAGLKPCAKAIDQAGFVYFAT
jgi:hypothetical protein